MINYDEDLEELDRIWPLGKQLVVPDGGTVLVAGAYEGRYMDYICTRFKPKIVLGFEPQADKANQAEMRLARHHYASRVFMYGIGVHDCLAYMEQTGTDGCRVQIGNSPNAAKAVTLRSVDSILDVHGPIDLFICNMEGYEIPLLAYLCVTARFKEIKSLAVQFHTESNVPFLLTKVYGVPVYDDLPTWGYWRSK